MISDVVTLEVSILPHSSVPLSGHLQEQRTGFGGELWSGLRFGENTLVEDTPRKCPKFDSW